MESIRNLNRIWIYLALILAAAFGLRLWGIWFGLPFSYRADEYHEVFRALELGSGSFNLERTGKGGYFYVLFLEYGVLFVALKIAGVIESAQDFARYFVGDPSSFYLIGRATTAAIGTLNVFLLYRLGARAYSTGAGLLAGTILTVDFLSAEHSHYITVDIPMTCLATAALLFAANMATGGSGRDYKWAAVFAALATTTKLPAILLLLPLLIAHYYYVRRKGGGPRQFFLTAHLWWAVAIFVVVLGITNPGLFLDPPMPAYFGDAGGADEGAVELEYAEAAQGTPPNFFIYYIAVLGDSMGWPLLLVSFAGILYGAWKRTPADVMLLAFACVFYLVFATSSHPHLYFPRYMLPVIVVLALMAGRLLWAAWPGAGAAKQTVAIVVVAALAFMPAYKTVVNNYLLSHTDTRTIAKEWIGENIPQGATVFIEGLKIEPTRLTVPLQDTMENMRDHIEFYETREPGKAKYLKYRLQAMSGSTYDLELVSPSELRAHDLDHYKDMGIEYLVIRPEYFVESRKIAHVGLSFLDELEADPDVSLVRAFPPNPRDRPGPLIHVYRIDSNVDGAAGPSNL
ncbi:MAG: glycosyltransferase family 39 protein [Gammaproteobacteria bacterium]|nr:glycosyltransferase family 39 protein [Gammaproteobacteria bacterium]